MPATRLTVRLKSENEASNWREYSERLKFSTLNKFIRTMVNKAISDIEVERESIEQRNRQRIDELEHQLDLTKAEVSERDRIIRSLKDEVMELRKEGYTPEIIDRKRGLFAEFQHILRTDGRMSRQDFLERVRSKYSFVDLGKLLIEVAQLCRDTQEPLCTRSMEHLRKWLKAAKLDVIVINHGTKIK